MKSKYSFACAILVLLFASVTFSALAQQQVKHIVVFKFKPTASSEQIAAITKSFKALKGKISGIISFESGVNNSPENLNKGFTHVYLVTFESREARNNYLVHPDHKKFVEELGQAGILDEPFVVDFDVEKQ